MMPYAIRPRCQSPLQQEHYMMGYRNRTAFRAFTLIELLIVILILSILMAVALPLYLNAVSDTDMKTCRTNMQTISNAEIAYKTRVATHTFTTNLALLAPDLGATPLC